MCNREARGGFDPFISRSPSLACTHHRTLKNSKSNVCVLVFTESAPFLLSRGWIAHRPIYDLVSSNYPLGF